MYTTSVEFLSIGGGGGHTTSVEYLFTGGVYPPPQWDIYPEGGCIPPQLNIYPEVGVYTTSMEYLSRGGSYTTSMEYLSKGGLYTTSMEYISRGGVHHLNGIFIQRGGVYHLNGIFIQRGGVYTTSVEYLSRGGRTPPQWNIFHGLPFSSMPHFSTLFFLSGGRVPPCCMVSHPFQFSIFTMVFLLVGGFVWGGGQEGRKGGGGYHTFIRLFLRCVLFYVLDTRCQIRLQTSDFIHIAGRACFGRSSSGGGSLPLCLRGNTCLQTAVGPSVSFGTRTGSCPGPRAFAHVRAGGRRWLSSTCRAVSLCGGWFGSSPLGRHTATWSCMRRESPATFGLCAGCKTCYWPRRGWPVSSHGAFTSYWGLPFNPLASP